jgi:membrane-bound lytic murein transglycosylase F
MQDDYPDLIIEQNLGLDSEQLLNLVWEKIIEYTVADSNEVEINQRYYPELRVAFELSEPEELAWAFPPGDDHSLIDQAKTYFNQLQMTGRLDQLLERYYGHVNDFDYVETRRYLSRIEKRLPKYRRWFIKAGEKTDIDWRLLAAIGYQESHWDPKAVSPTGVRGIMMITRDTMKQLGIDESRHDAETSIMGGSRYIKQIKTKIPSRIKEPDRTWMALAAYNVGFGHLEDARVLTQRDDADPDKWVNVKNYLPRLSQKKWYEQTKYGFARGKEPVSYVENVRDFYDILVWKTDRQQTNAIKSSTAIARN